MRGEQTGIVYTAPSFEDFKRLPESEDPLVFNFSLPEMKGHMRMLKKGKITLSDGTLQLSESGSLGHNGMRHFNEQPLVELNFVMEGNIVQNNSYLSRELHYVKGYHNIMYNQGEWEQNKFVGAGIHNTFTVHILAERFVELFSMHSDKMDNLAEKVLSGNPFLIEQPARPITHYMHTVIRELWNCPLHGSLKGLYMETKVTELILLQWGQFSLGPRPESVLKRKGDVEKMYLAKEILLKKMHEPLPDPTRPIVRH